jgi:hypothetical protein
MNTFIDISNNNEYITNNTENIMNIDYQITDSQNICDEFDGLIYHSGRGFIVSYDYAYHSVNQHVLLLCDKSVMVIPPINYIHQKLNKKECFVNKSINLTLLETNMELSYSNVVFGKKNIKILFGKLLHEEMEYQMICSLIKKDACNILALDNLTDNLINEIMKKQFNELDINTDFIIKDNKIIIGLNGY